MSIEDRLHELGLKLPPTPPAAGNYLPSVRVGNILHLAGTLAALEGKITHAGQVGKEQTVESGYEAARVCALNLLANIKSAAGSLDNVRRFVFVSGYVNGISGFADSPAVINGASDLIVKLYGDAGKHARAAVAVAGLPRNSAVEIHAIVELHSAD